MQKYETALKENGTTNVDGGLLQQVAKSLGPSIYLRDASMVSCTDQKELDRVKANFLVKKLGMTDGPELDNAIKSVCDEYQSNQRYRVVFYYLLARKLGKTV